MTRWLGKYSPYLYALLRIVAGLLFAMHGAQKLLGWPNKPPMELTTLFKAAGAIELVGGLLIAIGLFASIAAFIASGEMAVAYFTQHAPRATWPILNGGEMAVLFCFLFLYIASHGSGVWSIDALMGRRNT
ncbi:MAG TPA: DoxX family protein [Blastocatellia bacterium]|nr:DoxX family protein [Blastocatellia bacterium]